MHTKILLRIAFGLGAFILASTPSISMASESSSSMVESRDEIMDIFMNRRASHNGKTYIQAYLQYGTKSTEFWDWYEQHRKLMLERVTMHWQKYPEDPKRFGMIGRVLNELPDFRSEPATKTIEPGGAVDVSRRRDWLDDYALMRADVARNGATEAYWPRAIRVMEIINSAVELTELRNENKISGRSEMRVAEILESVLMYNLIDLASEFRSGPDSTQSAAHWLLHSLDGSSDPGAAARMLAALSKSPNEGMAKFAATQLLLRRFQETPVALSFRSFDNTQIDTADYRGKYLLVVIWCNTCAACIDEMPALQALQDRYRDRLQVLGVWCAGTSGDSATHEQKRALEHLARNGAVYPNAHLTHDTAREFLATYGIGGFPASWLFDEQGLLVATNIHGKYLESKIAARIRESGSE